MNIIHFKVGDSEYRLGVADETLPELVYDAAVEVVEVVPKATAAPVEEVAAKVQASGRKSSSKA